MGRASAVRGMLRDLLDTELKPVIPNGDRWYSIPIKDNLVELNIDGRSGQEGFGDKGMAYVDWRLTKPAKYMDQKSRNRLGLEAMRAVVDRLEEDALTTRQKRYVFSPATPSHAKLYATLIRQMKNPDYKLVPDEEFGFVLERKALNRDSRRLLAHAGIGAAGAGGLVGLRAALDGMMEDEE